MRGLSRPSRRGETGGFCFSRARWLAATALVLCVPPVATGAPSKTTPPSASAASSAAVRRLEVEAKPWTGDFDGMVERRVIRVLVPYSRSLYFNDQGHERGVSAEGVRGFERWLNQKYAKELRNRPITIVIVPTTRDRLLEGVAAGLADLAVGNITITDERRRLVDFVSDPDAPSVNEIVVTRRDAPLPGTADALAARTVHVRRSSSYYESVAALNARLAGEGKPPVNVALVPDALEDEDLLEMVDAGLLESVVVDDWKARMWAQILPGIAPAEQAVLRAGGRIGWAVRKGSPKLEAELAAYMKSVTKGVITTRLNKYMKHVKRLKNATAGSSRKRFDEVVALFEKYGRQYRFDPLMLAAQGYQESRLNQEARSPVGAIGVMQVMPATGEELRVGDIHLIEPNIHAGTKYMDRLMTRFFADADFDEMNRTLFAFASYNAGPGAISRMRAAAAKSGLDPNQWFNNVEVVTARKIGLETTTYVRNIFKYYVAYRLLWEARAAARSAREQLKPAKGE